VLHRLDVPEESQRWSRYVHSHSALHKLPPKVPDSRFNRKSENNSFAVFANAKTA